MSATTYNYLPADTILIVNDNDPDLSPIEVPLPPCPNITTIDGYGLPPEQQFFKRQVIPQGVKDLDNLFKDGEMSLDELWVYIQEYQHKLSSEIAWMATQIERSLNGYWVFINGKPTYIDGWHYKYYNFWHIESGLPEYRDRHRKVSHFTKFCYDDPFCFGFNYPKHRREGATSWAGFVNFQICSTKINANGGIQSMTDEDAEKVYLTHVLEPWKQLLFFFKPTWRGGSSPQKKMVFKSEGKKGPRAKQSTTYLGGTIDYREASPKAYDGFKLYFKHDDEVGKLVKHDINERHQVSMPCLAQGPTIHGFTMLTSTVGEMEGGGGNNFYRLCKASNYHERTKNGRTKSGLYTLFVSALEGLDGFIGPYGESIVEAPSDLQIEFLLQNPLNRPFEKYYREGMGSRAYLNSIRESFDEDGDMDKLDENIRQFPIWYRECFRAAPKGSFFDIKLIDARLDDLRFMPKATERGNIDWLDKKAKKVEWVPDPEGRFYKSINFTPQQINNFSYDHALGSYVPLNMGFCAGSDPFKYKTTEGKKGSMGGGAVFWGRDFKLDPKDKPIREWTSNRFVLTYNERVKDPKEYAEDMAKMCLYAGCPMFTEWNAPIVWDYFDENEMSGFLVYQFVRGKWKTNPGAYADNTTKGRLFSLYQHYIKRHCHREMHSELLIEVRDVGTPERMTLYDLFAAGGYAMMGLENVFTEEEVEEKNDSNLVIERYMRHA